MTEEEAKNIAKEHIRKMNANNPHAETMSWLTSRPRKTSSGFYFDYIFKLANPDNPMGFGGAPGYFIDLRTGEIKDLSWEELDNLNND